MRSGTSISILVVTCVASIAFAFSVVLAVTDAASAQTTQTASDPAAKPGAVSKVTTKSKETWADMKVRWAKQKDRWADCQKREKAEKRSATATRAFLDDCMTKQ